MNRSLPNFPRGRDELEILRKRSTGVRLKDASESLLNCFGHALNHLSRSDLGKLRERVIANFGAQHSFLEIVDGHVALRDALGIE